MSTTTLKQKDQPLRLTIVLDSTLVSPAYQMALKMNKHIIKHIIRSIILKGFPLPLITGLDSTSANPYYQMSIKMTKQIIKHIIRSITLYIIIPKILKKHLMTKSKHDQNINLAA